MSTVYRSHRESDTIRFARELALEIGGGSVVLLFGELGAGKTAFVRGLVEGAGGETDQVSSPTFTLIQPYAGHITVNHVDLYRVKPRDVDELGLDELSTSSTIVAIEWADRLQRPPGPGQAIRVYISDEGDDERDIRVEVDA